MSRSETNPKVDAYLKKTKEWPEEIRKLRTIILGCGLTEEFKWGKPCYSFEGSNVVVIIPLKASCALMFAKGVLLKDARGILTKPGENSQSGRWIKFTGISEIAKREAVLKAYIREAIAAEKAGLKVTYKKISKYAIPEEFQNQLAENPALKKAYEALTPGRQRGYLMHFSAPKQSQTRVSRVEKCIPLILKGRGLNDR